MDLLGLLQVMVVYFVTTTLPPILSHVLGAGAILILLVNVRFPKIVELITAVAILWANLAYLLVVAAMLWQRLSGKTEAQQDGFSLARFGLAVNVLAMLWSAFMVVNVSWPRADVYGEENRFAAVRYTAALAAAGGIWFWLRTQKGSIKTRAKNLLQIPSRHNQNKAEEK